MPEFSIKSCLILFLNLAHKVAAQFKLHLMPSFFSLLFLLLHRGQTKSQIINISFFLLLLLSQFTIFIVQVLFHYCLLNFMLLRLPDLLLISHFDQFSSGLRVGIRLLFHFFVHELLIPEFLFFI